MNPQEMLEHIRQADKAGAKEVIVDIDSLITLATCYNALERNYSAQQIELEKISKKLDETIKLASEAPMIKSLDTYV